MLHKMNVQRDEIVLDPFAGAGTTLIESKLEGRGSVGVEINPLLHFVNEVSLEWSVCPTHLLREVERIETGFAAHERAEIDQVDRLGLAIPPIHNPLRWWRPDVLVDLLILRRQIDQTPDFKVRQLLRLIFAGVLVPDLTNVTLGKLQLHFIDRSHDTIDVWGTFASHAKSVAHDLESLSEMQSAADARCYLGSSMEIDSLAMPSKIDAVITSPPYPNRYSYVWNTRPHLYMLGLMQTGKEAADLDKRTIGGTWGTATSELQKGVFAPYNTAVADVIEPICAQIRQEDNLMANYVMHYFNRLTQQIVKMDTVFQEHARVAYVVGNSWVKGIYVETDVLLGEIFERSGLGYTTTELHRFRKRHSGKDLYETIVYAAK
jgi:DNA modification methylase